MGPTSEHWEKQIEDSIHASLPDTEDELLSSPLSTVDNPMPSEENGNLAKLILAIIHCVYLSVLSYYLYLAAFIILLILFLFIK